MPERAPTNKLVSAASARPTLGELRWRCRRGMLELDVLLGRFLDRCYDRLSDAQLEALVETLRAEDDELWDWLRGQGRPKEQRIAEIVELISGCR